MGIVFVQNITMISIWQSILTGLENTLHTNNYFITFTVTFLIAMAIPILLLGLASYAAKKFNNDSVVKNFARFGYAIIALDVAGHIAHNLFHLLAEGRAVHTTGASFFMGQAAQAGSSALLDDSTIQVLQYGLVALGVLGSLYTAYRISKSNNPRQTWTTLAPYAVLILVLGAANVYLFSMPMAMRM
jgi:hypothetical protein